MMGPIVNVCRHPELVCACTPAAPGSISPLVPSGCVARWMLKRVQHDVGGNASLRPLRLCVNPYFRRPSAGWGPSRLSAKWFAQRREGIKKLLPVFVSSCEPKCCRARKYKTMGPRFRGNDNVGVLGCVNPRGHEGIKRLLRVFVSSCELKTYRVRKYKTMGSRFRGNDNVGVSGA
jgi:hypothetical protein